DPKSSVLPLDDAGRTALTLAKTRALWLPVVRQCGAQPAPLVVAVVRGDAWSLALHHADQLPIAVHSRVVAWVAARVRDGGEEALHDGSRFRRVRRQASCSSFARFPARLRMGRG